jgi:DNA-binding GntR family transcriptional regulator
MLPRMTDLDAAQRLVLRALLDAHPRLIGIDELAEQLADVSRVREALSVLVDDGLATRLGDRVGVSRAAVRFAVLGPPVAAE